MKTNVLGIQFDNLTREEARQAGRELLRGPEFLLAAEKDLEFQKILNRADLVLPDGIGVVYSAKILGTPLKERVAGFDFACDMLEELNELGGRLYLLGAKPGVAEEAAAKIVEQHPKIVICGTHDGYFKESDPVAREVAAAQPEKWIARFGLLTGAKMAIGLGGALDVFAGNVERAPEKWQKMGMEWAYRLSREPKRFGRMAKLPLVLVKAAGQRVTGRRRPGVL